MFLFTLLPLTAGEESGAARSAARISALRGDWRTAETEQRRALALCRGCTPEELAGLRADLAGYLTLGGFPEAAIPLWKTSIAELAEGSPMAAVSQIGLGVSLHAAGRAAEAERVWAQACRTALADKAEDAACRFNIAVARMETAPVWGELEELLPVLLSEAGPMGRVTALLQTARGAIAVGRLSRAAELLDQAEGTISEALDARHPFRRLVYEARAGMAEREGKRKEAREWRKKALRAVERNGWERGTVSVEELRGKRR